MKDQKEVILFWLAASKSFDKKLLATRTGIHRKKKTYLKHPYFCLLGEPEPIPLSQVTTHKRPPLPIPTQSPLLSPSHLLPHSPVTAEHNGSQRRSFPSPACRHRWLLCLVPAPSVSAESACLCFLAVLSSVSASLAVAVVDGASALLAPSLLAGGLPLQPQPVAVFLLLLLQWSTVDSSVELPIGCWVDLQQLLLFASSDCY
ncbi:hypothetical protein Ahy_A07g036771 isoform B [Arachis hypogaea]|uniref:Uncharacterized protein n=1 Tax=Arachis hypogaea TaxID=3818 RepID=A0A445CGX7_ARAHY|nr:hypothetical protein Ahy_A07g036771 isoform B [Arachis hypogaea]